MKQKNEPMPLSIADFRLRYKINIFSKSEINRELLRKYRIAATVSKVLKILDQCKYRVIVTGNRDDPERRKSVKAYYISSIAEHFEKAERTCKICGCTDSCACPGGCYWVRDDGSKCANFDCESDKKKELPE